MVGWHHRLNGHEFEQTLEDSEEQGSLACCSPWGLKESACQCRRCEFDPGVGKREEEMATHSSILAGKSHGQRRLAGYSPWDL